MDRTPHSESNTVQELRAQVTHLGQRIAALESLQEVTRTFSTKLELKRLLELILSSAIDVMKAGAGSLLLYDSEAKELVFQVVQGGGGKALRSRRIRSNEGIAGWVFTRRHPVIVHDPHSDSRFLSSVDASLKFHTADIVAAPMVYKGRAIGVIEILNKKSGEQFNDDDQDLLVAFAAQSAVLIENARLYQQIVAERDRLLAAEEQIRRELARELHDGPSQLLSAIIMGLKFVKEVIRREPDRTEGELDELERLSTQALHQVRNMLFDLRPVVLETHGLRAAFQVYGERQQATEQVNIHLDTDSLTMRFPPKVEAAIYSIVQEAVVNARKHAQAQSIWITAQQSEQALALSVRDDGRGFDLSQVETAYAQRGNFGLLTMKERAEICNARLTIDSKPGKGTTVTLVVPLSPPRSSGTFGGQHSQ